MGWLFTVGSTRRELIAERTESWERQSGEMLVKSTCLAHCFRGGRFSGVLWSVWERKFEGGEARPTERWIQCDLLRYSRSNDGWGYKDTRSIRTDRLVCVPLVLDILHQQGAIKAD
jgi:hypothetical protein